MFSYRPSVDVEPNDRNQSTLRPALARGSLLPGARRCHDRAAAEANRLAGRKRARRAGNRKKGAEGTVEERHKNGPPRPRISRNLSSGPRGEC
jgi:hypothetical protein